MTMRKIVIFLLLLCLFPQIVKAENHDNRIIIQKSGQSLTLVGELKLNDVENAYPGYQFPKEKILIENKTDTPQVLSISLTPDSGLENLKEYFDGEIVVTSEVNHQKKKFIQLPLQLTEELSAHETLEVSITLGIKGEETSNEAQNKKGKLLWEVSVVESYEHALDKSEEGKGKLPITSEVRQLGLIFLGMLLLAFSIGRYKWVRIKVSENKRDNLL